MALEHPADPVAWRQENATPPWTTIAERTTTGSFTEFLYPMVGPRVMLRVEAG